MIFQYILLAIVVGIAAWYIFKKLREPFHDKKECGGSCAKCNALDKLNEVKK